MGTQLTKIGQGINEDEPVQASLPSTPILTPKTRTLDLDPRSPTANIVRTPIQVTNGLNHTPVIGELKSLIFESSLDDSTFDNAVVNIDPRSPSVEFTRTPIVIEKSSIKIRNKNLDKVKTQITDFSPFKKKSRNIENEKKQLDTSIKQIKGPILLESSPIIKKNDQSEKRKSYVGLLETNLDYVETDLDTVSKRLNNSVLLNKVESKEEEKIEEIVEQIENSETETNEIEEQINVANEEKSNNTEISEVNTEPNRTDIIDKTATKITQIDEEIKEVIAVSVDPTTDFDKNNICKIDEEIRDIITSNQKSNVESQNPVIDFDKKVTNLIYEDEKVVDIPAVKQNRPKDVNRTPLGDRNRINHKTKSTNKLKVSDKPKGDYTVSKIPVFKDKNSKYKMTQCENTPPTLKIAESRVKKSQWDADNTLII